MAKPEEKQDGDTLMDIGHLKRDYSEDLQAHDDAIVDFDAFEAMHLGKTFDDVSRESQNGLTDSMTATIYGERAQRVAGQLPEGEVKAFGKKDSGKALFMDLIRTKWIYPNANAQRPFKQKMFLWQYGSSMYGWMPMYYDTNVTPNGYFGPDCWLWNPRNFIPQAGFTTVSEMDYVHALTYQSPKFFEELLEDEEDDTWDKGALREVIEIIKNETTGTDTKRNTVSQQEKQNQDVRQVCVATRYEAGEDGRWVTFLPKHSYKVLRNIPNPHKNGRIPFVIKPCIPSFDSFYCVGDFQRSMSMQAANDGLDNYYFEGIKRNLFPRTHINATTIVPHTMSTEPWAVVEWNGTPEFRVEETSTAGLSTYQAAKGSVRGALQSIAGTTDTRANADNAMDPGMGKTPEALQMIQARESTRDNQDRELLEQSMQELLDGMLSLIPTIAEKIPVEMFEDEVEEITERYPDLMDIFKKAVDEETLSLDLSDSEKQMTMNINPSKLKDLDYRMEIVPNSTAKKTKEEQLVAFKDFFGFLGTIQNVVQDYQAATGTVMNLEMINKTFKNLSDVPGIENLFVPAPKPSEPSQGEQPQQEAPQEAAQPHPAEVNPLTGQPVSPDIAQGISQLKQLGALHGTNQQPVGQQPA